LTTFEGDKDFAAFSPDASRIAFSWNGGRQGTHECHIYVKEIGAGEPVQLTSAPQDDRWPAWSQDGRRIAFVRMLPEDERAIYVVPSSGGPERMLAKGGVGASWSPDGKWLALADAPMPKGTGGLFLLSLETGERRQLDTPQKGGDCLPVYSPDGRWIAFMRMRLQRDVFILPASGDSRAEAARQLTFDQEPKLGLTWTPDSREIVYSTIREYGGSGLWRVPVSGGEPHRILPTLLFAANPNISRTGNRLAYTESWIDSNLYESEGPGFTKRGVPQPFGNPEKVIASSHEDHSPNFSPDGKRIAFVSNRTGHSEIWTAHRDGSGQTQLTHFESFTGTPHWSPDARWIVFDCIVRGNQDIWVIPSSGGTPHRLTTGSSADTMPSWSPNGAWIYFNSDRSGVPEIWKMKPDGSAAQQLTRHGGREALASQDGRTIYYTKAVTGSPIWQVPAEGGLEKAVAGMEPFNNIGRAWGVLKQGIYFVSRQEGTEADIVRFFRFENRRVTPLYKWQRTARWTSPALALSPDGQYLLTVQIDQQVNDLMKVENFR
jgi:Tol biopolymer transport system component